MASFNRVILMGNLTRDPELRTLPNSDTQVCDFSLAVNRRWKDANGGDREDVLFIDCAAFGRTGQTIGESLTKGRPIHIEGYLKFEQWEQEDGQRRSKIRVVVEQFRFVDAKPGSGKSGNGKPAGRTADALALAENFVREAMHPMDEAIAFANLAREEAKGVGRSAAGVRRGNHSAVEKAGGSAHQTGGEVYRSGR